MGLPPITDRRLNPRKRVLLAGVVVYGQGSHFYKCLVRYVTAHGVRINVPRGQPLPSEVYFINLSNQTGHKARVAWHKGSEAGLAFQSSMDLQTIADPGPGYLKRIWLAHTFASPVDDQ